MRWDQTSGDLLEVAQGKTGANLRIAIIGELKMVIDQIKARSVVGVTIVADPKGQKRNGFGYFCIQFDKARDATAAETIRPGIGFQRFQFRELRPKAATDLESLAGAQKLLGNTIAANICGRRGNAVQPLLSKKQRDGEKSFRQK